jgi:hypothetical protein
MENQQDIKTAPSIELLKTLLCKAVTFKMYHIYSLRTMGQEMPVFMDRIFQMRTLF